MSLVRAIDMSNARNSCRPAASPVARLSEWACRFVAWANMANESSLPVNGGPRHEIVASPRRINPCQNRRNPGEIHTRHNTQTHLDSRVGLYTG
ncbi:hypothetical protein LSAT2_021095 [Lamellibrachia satsuma]|nr:hypothetical protein LSAT2_021095 [Lamellibrachia satsuma]